MQGLKKFHAKSKDLAGRDMDEPPPYSSVPESSTLKLEQHSLLITEPTGEQAYPAEPQHLEPQSNKEPTLPLYSATDSSTLPPSATDVIHHLSPSDTITALSLAYHIPSQVLRSHNHLHSDLLLPARRILLMPRTHYNGPSLSPHHRESSQEDERKRKIRRLMVTCKISEYEVAVVYLNEAEWDLNAAAKRWTDDEAWERDHPLVGVPGSSTNPRSVRAGGSSSSVKLAPARVARLLK